MVFIPHISWELKIIRAYEILLFLYSLITFSSSISNFSRRVSKIKRKIAEQCEETDGSSDDKIHLTFTTCGDGELD